MSTQPCGCDPTAKPTPHVCPDHSFESPQSSNVTAARYDVSNHNLTVTFHRGRTYVYQGVPPSIWDAFKSAESKGEYFTSIIRDTWVGVRTA